MSWRRAYQSGGMLRARESDNDQRDTRSIHVSHTCNLRVCIYICSGVGELTRRYHNIHAQRNVEREVIIIQC